MTAEVKTIDMLEDLVESARQILSNLRPSDWAEQHRVMSTENSPFPGPFSYDRTPYTREIIDHLSPDSPARWVAVMKAVQIGLSAGLIENGIGYIISENPGNVLFLSGHQDLSEEMMATRVDQMIESCGLRHLIRPNVQKKKNQRTGDTVKMKEFPGGNLIAGSAGNHKLLRQRTARFGFFDDFDGVKSESKEAGSTRKLAEKRFSAFGSQQKIFFISTPELKETSNIEPVYEEGDRRHYFVPCPCCGDYIPLLWTVDMEGTEGTEKGGITWKTNDDGKLIPESVGYICQKCGGFFDESVKMDLVSRGEWRPTCEPSRVGFYSYHISGLYAPAGMDNWTDFVYEYLDAFKEGGKEADQKAFVNTRLGQTFEPSREEIKANDLQTNNIRPYKIGEVPQTLSQADGNGDIVLLTLACDLNGIEQDARLDWEVVAWAETGSTYSVQHGSIGTFIPRENSMRNKPDRLHWTYEIGKPNNVWVELTKIMNTKFPGDTGKKYPIFMAGIDTGRYTQHAYTYIDSIKNAFRVGLKGRDESKLMRYAQDVPTFAPARERKNLYMVEVNAVKDDLAELVRLRWDDRRDEKQPPGFMNYPTPSDGLYLAANYFNHYEAEHKIFEKTKDGKAMGFRWVKKNTSVQNHMFDVRVYNNVLRDILVDIVGRTMKSEMKGLPFTWGDLVKIILYGTI